MGVEEALPTISAERSNHSMAEVAMNEGFDGSYDALLKRVESMLGDRQSAEQWISEPALGLNGARPVDMLASTEGVRLLDELLVRLEYGVYT